jgi:predicted RNA-binding Zn ribbon-like protein
MSKSSAQTPSTLIAQTLEGRLALDFANAWFAGTGTGRESVGYAALVDFLVAREIVRAAARPALLELWATAPDESAEFLGRAIALRDASRMVFEARIAGQEILPDDVVPINQILAYAEGFDQLELIERLEEGQQEWRLALHSRSQELEWLLTAIARSAAELIAEGPAAPIRKCANPACGLLFYDNSRTGKRRWCSMAVCGNRAKVAAHYRREKNK